MGKYSIKDLGSIHQTSRGGWYQIVQGRSVKGKVYYRPQFISRPLGSSQVQSGGGVELVTNQAVSDFVKSFQQPVGDCSYIPIGTRLYHGTLECQFEKCRSPCFYGLSPVPSIAMLMEKTFGNKTHQERFEDWVESLDDDIRDAMLPIPVTGCINEYVVTQPIPVVLGIAGMGSDVGRYQVGTKGYQRALRQGTPLEDFAYIRKTCDRLPEMGHWLNRSTAPVLCAYGDLIHTEPRDAYSHLLSHDAVDLFNILYDSTSRTQFSILDWELVTLTPLSKSIKRVTQRFSDVHELTLRFHQRLYGLPIPVSQELIEGVLYDAYMEVSHQGKSQGQVIRASHKGKS